MKFLRERFPAPESDPHYHRLCELVLITLITSCLQDCSVMTRFAECYRYACEQRIGIDFLHVLAHFIRFSPVNPTFLGVSFQNSIADRAPVSVAELKRFVVRWLMSGASSREVFMRLIAQDKAAYNRLLSWSSSSNAAAAATPVLPDTPPLVLRDCDAIRKDLFVRFHPLIQAHYTFLAMNKSVQHYMQASPSRTPQYYQMCMFVVYMLLLTASNPEVRAPFNVQWAIEMLLRNRKYVSASASASASSSSSSSSVSHTGPIIGMPVIKRCYQLWNCSKNPSFSRAFVSCAIIRENYNLELPVFRSVLAVLQRIDAWAANTDPAADKKLFDAIRLPSNGLVCFSYSICRYYQWRSNKPNQHPIVTPGELNLVLSRALPAAVKAASATSSN